MKTWAGDARGFAVLRVSKDPPTILLQIAPEKSRLIIHDRTQILFSVADANGIP